MVRKAQVKDIKRVHELVGYYAKKGLMLPRPENEVAENLRDFFIYGKDNAVVGCAALHIFSDKLSEIRSLAVDPGHISEGIGTRLVEACLKEAGALGIKSVFVLTQKSNFFKRFGFISTEKKLPQKIWTDCSICPKFAKCDEIAYIKEL